VLTGKLFEYLGARRRILAVGGPVTSSVDVVLAQTDAGIRALGDDEIEREIVDAVHEYRAGIMRLTDASRAGAYDAATMSKRFAAVLDRSVRMAGTAAHAPAVPDSP
jgi:hypothetical protein